MTFLLEKVIDPIEAAISSARSIGLNADTARPISLLGRAVILLEPCQVVAKIAPLADRLRSETEVALATHVLSHQGPVVPPLLNGPPGPHTFDDVVVSFWEFRLPGRPPEDTDLAAVSSYSQLAPHLQSFGGVLPDFRDPINACHLITQQDRLERLTSDAKRMLRVEFERFSCLQFSQSDSRNLLGDAHVGNLVHTEDATLWLDLKAACTGPVEWDLTALPTVAGLDPVNPDILDLFKRVRSACVVVWCAQKATPAPSELEAIQVHLDLLGARG